MLELPSLAPNETEFWQHQFNTLLRTCGCSEATAALLVNLGVLATFGYGFWNVVKSMPFLAIAIGLVCSILSIAAGKAFGKWRGRRRLANSVRDLQAMLLRHEFAPRTI